MPLWGSYLSKEQALRLAHLYEHVYLFLDHDKREASIKLAIEHTMRLHITPIIAKLDPKCYSDEEMAELLKGHHA